MPRLPLTRFTMFLAVLTLLAAPLAAQLPPEAEARIEKLVSDGMAEAKVPGLSLAIGMGGRVVYSKGFGMADLENAVPVQAATVFRTASIAKPMTATAVMQLVEAGKMDLDAPIQTYCPAFPEKQWPVTARHLLGHLSGVRHYQKPGESSGTEHFFALGDSLRLFKDDPLRHEPGAKFTYSTYGYSVLGCAIEGASGLPYEQYMAERVFAPAGMSRTRTDHHYFLISHRARGYQKLDQDDFDRLPKPAQAVAKVGDLYNAALHDTSMKVPGGGLLSTAEDLVRFVSALRASKLVQPQTLSQMWTSLSTSDGKPTSYGLGWNIPQSQGGKVVLHTGGQAGASTVLAIRTDKDFVVAIMTNLQGFATLQLARRIMDELPGVKD